MALLASLALLAHLGRAADLPPKVCTATTPNGPAVLKKVRPAPANVRRRTPSPLPPMLRLRQSCIDSGGKMNVHVWVNPHEKKLQLPLMIETQVEGDANLCTAPDSIVLCDAAQTVNIEKFRIDGGDFDPKDGSVSTAWS